MVDYFRFGIGIGAADAFWVQVNEALYQRSLRHSVKLIPINQSSVFTPLTPHEENALLEEIVSQELDVLLGWSFSEALSSQVLNMGVPIVHLFETTVDHPLCVSPTGLQKIAEDLIHFLAQRLNYVGTVLVVGGLLREELPDDGRSRMMGVQAALQQYPNMTYHHIMSAWGEEDAYTAVYEGLKNWDHPIDAILGLSDSMALMGQKVALAMGRCSPNTPVVGINGDPLGLAAVIEGRMVATVETPPAGLANQAFDIALKIASGQLYPSHYEFNPRLITEENVAKATTDRLVAIADIPSHLVNFERSEQQEYRDYLETSLNISRQLVSVLDYKQLPVELARLIRTNYAYDHVQLLYWSEHEQMLTLIEEKETRRPMKRLSLLDAGVLREALISDKPIYIPDSQRSIRYEPDPDWGQTRSRVILPIRQNGRVLALLDLHAYRVIHCTRQHLMSLQSLGDQIGVAIRNAQLYEEALQAKLVAEKADQLKSRLLANVSHELRNPLHIILACVGKLDMFYGSMGELPQIQNNAVHLLRLINDLVDLSRAEIDELSITPEVIEPIRFLTDVFESMAETTRDEAAVIWKLDLPDRLPVIQADPDRLRQILLNLLSNAKKFTSEGQIILSAEVAVPYFHIWIQDTGIGIPAQQQQLIFEPFASAHQANRRKDGVGLGLSITRRLVALHGGLMTVESHLEKGSIFHVYLPLPNLANTPVIQTNKTQPILLVVSSKPSLSPEVIAYSQHQALECYQIRTYQEIETALRAGGLPAAIAWDAGIATEDEWQIIQQLRSNPQLCNLPFLLYGQAADETRMASSRITSILLKPISPKTLLQVINGLFTPNEAGIILVVDDDASTLTLYRNLITEELPVYTCRTASNGEEALEVMQSCTPILVILDLMMPEVDGFEVIQRMRANSRTRNVPIMILSGKILTLEDIKQLEPYQKVMFQSKNVLSDEEFILSLQQVLFDAPTLPPQTSMVVKHAVAFIQQHYEQSLSRQEIAQSVGVSENYLTHIFHQELGVSLWDYLNRYRVLQAKELLKNTHNSIAYISSQVGFDDPAYFSRVFRRYVGQSPRVYRSHPGTE